MATINKGDSFARKYKGVEYTLVVAETEKGGSGPTKVELSEKGIAEGADFEGPTASIVFSMIGTKITGWKAGCDGLRFFGAPRPKVAPRQKTAAAAKARPENKRAAALRQAKGHAKKGHAAFDCQMTGCGEKLSPATVDQHFAGRHPLPAKAA